MSSSQLTVRVFLEGREPFDVTTALIDHNMWDMTRAKHKWPTAQEAPLTWMGFLAWSAARRSGAIDATMTWDAFLADCLYVERPDDDDEDVTATADPTQKALGHV